MEAPIRRNKTDELSSSTSPTDPEELAEEMHVARVVGTFRSYRDYSERKIERKLNFLANLPKDHQEKLIRYRESLMFQLKCVQINDEVMRQIAGDVNIFENECYRLVGDTNGSESLKFVQPSQADHEKTHSILKQIGMRFTHHHFENISNVSPRPLFRFFLIKKCSARVVERRGKRAQRMLSADLERN